MSRSLRLIAVAACAAAVATFASAGPAGAASHPAANATQARAAGLHPNTVGTTPYGNGYFSYPGTGDVASASVTFTMPTFTCTHQGDSEWLSPGIWVYDSSGNLTQFSGAEFNCNDGALFMGDVMCVDSYTSCDDSISVSPGDKLVASLYESSTQTYASVHDLTSGGFVSITGPAVTTDETVFLGDEGPSIASTGGVSKIPTYTQQIHFSKAQVNGLYLRDWSPAHYNLKTGTSLQEKSTALTGDGDGFTATFVHS